VIDGFFTPVGKNQKEDTVGSCQSFKERYLNQSAKETRKLLIFRVICGILRGKWEVWTNLGDLPYTRRVHPRIVHCCAHSNFELGNNLKDTQWKLLILQRTIPEKQSLKETRWKLLIFWVVCCEVKDLWLNQIEESHNPAIKRTSIVLIRIMALLGLTPNFNDYGQTE